MHRKGIREVIGRERIALVVTGIRAEARDVISIDLKDPAGDRLPAFSPGAHLALTLPAHSSGQQALVRHYSICSSPALRDHYVIAVGRAESSRGGSRAVHELVRVGMTLQSSAPNNNFELDESATHYRFVAGGIGITPILSMIKWCEERVKPWTLLYCARNRLRAAFYEELRAYGKCVTFHFDEEQAGRFADIPGALAPSSSGEHVYCCGPAPLMRAVRQACEDRPAGTVHFESFAGSAADVSKAEDRPFTVVLRTTGQEIAVAARQSLLEALEAHGVQVPFSCREGLCRTCEVGICAGEADHRDFVLSDAERAAQTSMLVCVSRAKSAELVLDL